MRLFDDAAFEGSAVEDPALEDPGLENPALAGTAAVPAWSGLPFVGFDLETTGPDPRTARIVQAAILETVGDPGTAAPADAVAHEWLVDPGVEIPAEAAAVHGIDTVTARATGRPAAQAVAEIAATLARLWAAGHAVVIYNASYDLTVLAAELDRYGHPPLASGVVLDPLVLWRRAERYRKGKKRLGDAAERFGIDPGAAHDATSDARTAIGVAHALCRPDSVDPSADAGGPTDLLACTAADLMRLQADWHREWAVGFADWLRSRGGDHTSVELHWPLRVG